MVFGLYQTQEFLIVTISHQQTTISFFSQISTATYWKVCLQWLVKDEIIHAGTSLLSQQLSFLSQLFGIRPYAPKRSNRGITVSFSIFINTFSVHIFSHLYPYFFSHVFVLLTCPMLINSLIKLVHTYIHKLISLPSPIIKMWGCLLI